MPTETLLNEGHAVDIIDRADQDNAPPGILPSELLDRIIDFLHDDKKALSACSLAWRPLIPCARSHLFHIVKFHKRDSERTLLAVFCHPLSTVAPYLRHLFISDDQDGHWFRIPFTQTALQTLPESLFGEVESLRLSRMRLDARQSDKEQKWWRLLLSKVRCLVLDHLVFQDRSALLNFISTAKSVNQLKITSVYFLSTKKSLDRSHHDIPPLGKLEISLGDFQSEAIVPYLRCGTPSPVLHTLTLFNLKSVHARVVSSELKILGPVLQHLSLDFSDPNLDRVLTWTEG